jgi:hypothetical protein
VSETTGEEIPGDELVFTPESDDDRASADVGVRPAAADTYYVRIDLYDPKGVALDRVRTGSFAV